MSKPEDRLVTELATYLCELDHRQLMAVMAFAMHLQIGSVSPLFFSQIATALEGSLGDECRS